MIRTHKKTLLALASAALATTPSLYAVNAAWNTDASSGNFNTAQWTSGVTTPAAGGTYTVLSNDALYFGTQTTGATALTNDLTSATFAGLTFNSGASAFTIGGNAFTLNGNITNSSASLQTINNSMTGLGGRTISGGTGGLTLGGTLSSTGSTIFNGTIQLTGATTVDGGSTTNTGWAAIGSNAATTVTISNGGSLAIKGNTGAAKPNSAIGQTSGLSTVNVGATDKSSSGTFTVEAGTGLLLGNSGGSATLNIYSGTATINRGTVATTTNGTDTRMIMMGRDSAASTATINLNGGTLATDRQFVRDGSSSAGSGTANFVFNGGTLKALGTQTDWLQSTTATSAGQNAGATGGTVNTSALALSSVTTTSTDSTIDANTFTVGINNAITGVGGFHIIDSSVGKTGIVNFGGSSYAYTGATSVDSGTLNTNAASVTFAGSMAVAGGTLTINGASAGTLAVGTNSFTMTLGTLSYSLGDQITGSGTFGITGGTLDLTNSISDYSITYTVFNGFTSGSVSSLTIANYDTVNWVAALGANGVLSFTSAIPEPSTYAALAGLGVLGLAACRRRRQA